MSPSVGAALARTLFQSYLSDPGEVQEGCSFLGRWKSMFQTAALAPLIIWVLRTGQSEPLLPCAPFCDELK